MPSRAAGRFSSFWYLVECSACHTLSRLSSFEPSLPASHKARWAPPLAPAAFSLRLRIAPASLFAHARPRRCRNTSRKAGQKTPIFTCFDSRRKCRQSAHAARYRVSNATAIVNTSSAPAELLSDHTKVRRIIAAQQAEAGAEPQHDGRAYAAVSRNSLITFRR